MRLPHRLANFPQPKGGLKVEEISRFEMYSWNHVN